MHEPFSYNDVGPATGATYDQVKAACHEHLREATHGVVQFTLYRQRDGELAFTFRAMVNPNDRDCLTVEDVATSLSVLRHQVGAFVGTTVAAIARQIDERGEEAA